MNCPVCNSADTKVNGSVTDFVAINHRYLSCKECGTIFQTVESIVEGTVISQYYLPFMNKEENKTATEEPDKDKKPGNIKK